MRMRKNEWLSSVLISVMCMMLVLAGCTSVDKTNKNQPSSTNQAAANTADAGATNTPAKTANKDPFGKYDPPISMSGARASYPSEKFLPGEDLSNNSWIRGYAEQLGIKLTYAFTASSEGTPSLYTQKLNVSMASNALPDVFTVDSRQLKELAEAGKLEDLTGAWGDYASPELKEIYKRDGGVSLKAASNNGKLYGVPKLNGGDLGQARMIWIRTDWLKKLNLPEPKTMQDVWSISEAFTTKDPDGNGKPDTHGVGLSKSFYASNFGTEGLFQGYHAYPQLWVKDAAGQLQYGSVQPEMKTVLTAMQDLYKKGVIDKEFAVKDQNNIIEDVAQNKVGILSGLNWLCYMITDGVQKNPEMEWKPFPILSADSKPALVGVPFSTTEFTVVKKGYSHPEALIKITNMYYQKYNSTSLDDYFTYEADKNDPSNTFFDNALIGGHIPINYDLTIAKDLQDAFKTKDPSKLKPDEQVYYKNIEKYNAGDRKQWATNKQRGLVDSAYNVWQEYDKKYMAAEFYGVPTPTMIDKKSTLDKLEIETFTKIIMGSASIDAFDKFVKDWKALGGDAITKEINDWKKIQN